MRSLCIAIVSATWSIVPTAPAQVTDTWGPPQWTLERLGFTDEAYTRDDGFQSSAILSSDGIGRLVGKSTRFQGSQFVDESLWTWASESGIEEIGLTDALHTSTSGRREAILNRVTASGRILGNSTSYSGESRYSSTGWIWTLGEGTTPLGLTDAEHTNSAGRRGSRAVSIDENGNVTGTSTRYAGAASLGVSAWIWSPVHGHDRIGLLDAEHTRSDGFRANQAGAFSGEMVSGNARRYSGMTDLGYSLWIWNAGGSRTTTRVGLVDAEHTNVSGLRLSQLISLSGGAEQRASGYSIRYGDGRESGRTAWTWTPSAGHVRLGLVDAEHTRADGYRFSMFSWADEEAAAFGYSSRFAEDREAGSTAWIWSPSEGLTRVGLTDARHTRDDGYRSSSVSTIGNGHRVGVSERFDGLSSLGSSAWVLNESNEAVSVGLVDAEHTGPSGEQSSTATLGLTPMMVIGTSRVYPAGASVWAWTPSDGTIRLGLTDAEHTGPNNQRESGIVRFNGAGQVIGFSSRYRNGVVMGRTIWHFDGNTRAFTPLRLSTGPGGESFTEVMAFSADGVVVGAYDAYQASEPVARRAFAWSASRGFADLGNLAAGGVVSEGFGSLSAATHAIGSGLWDAPGPTAIVGTARLPASESAALFVLSAPACPADFNGDGLADDDDVSAFVRAFDNGEAGSDWNGDGFVDLFDLIAFAETSDIGC